MRPHTRPRIADMWQGLGTRFLPFADAASDTLPLPRLLRLSLFQVSAGMALTLLTGTLNRVMILELAVPAVIVAVMLSLPLVFAPLRALIGHRSDTHRSVLGWRRGPYIWFGSMFMFGGLAIMPFALLILAGDTHGPAWIGQLGAALAFLMVGAGLHTVQTAGLALATDIAPEDTRPRVVALLYVMLLVGMGVSALVFGWLLSEFSQLQLIKVIQGSAVVAMALNLIALWKQEPRLQASAREDVAPSFAEALGSLTGDRYARRLLVAVGLGAAAFSMQDVLLEPYGGEILGMSVAATTRLTALFALGTLGGFALAARQLGRGADPHRLAAVGLLAGIGAFSLVIFSDPLGLPLLFQAGAALIGFGGGLFSVCTLTAAMTLAESRDSGIALGTWGAVNATAVGLALALGGAIRDGVGALAGTGRLGEAFMDDAVGYSVVYHLEILLLFATMVVIGPLARLAPPPSDPNRTRDFGLAAFPN